MVDEAVGSGQQQLNNLTPPPPPPPPPGEGTPDLVNNPGTGNTAQAGLGFNSSMSNLEPPQRGDADRFVLAALLQASVNAPTSYLAQIENTSGPMSQSDYASYLSSIMGQSVDLSGPSPVSLEEVLNALFSLYHIDAGPGGVVAKATELGLLPEGVGTGELTRGEVYEILDAAFFNLKMPNGRTLYQASFDSTPPTVTIGTFPAVVEGTTLTLQGLVSPGTTLLQVGYNDSDVVTVGEDGTWTATIPLEPGMNTITVQAHDAAGNITTRTIQVLCTAGGA